MPERRDTLIHDASALHTSSPCRWRGNRRIHNTTSRGERRQSVFIGLYDFNLSTVVLQYFHRLIKRDYTLGRNFRRSFECEDHHPIETGRQIGVVRGIVPAVNIMLALKQDGRPT